MCLLEQLPRVALLQRYNEERRCSVCITGSSEDGVYGNILLSFQAGENIPVLCGKARLAFLKQIMPLNDCSALIGNDAKGFVKLHCQELTLLYHPSSSYPSLGRSIRRLLAPSWSSVLLLHLFNVQQPGLCPASSTSTVVTQRDEWDLNQKILFKFHT